MIKEEWKINNCQTEDKFQSQAMMHISQYFPEFRDKAFHVKNENYIQRIEGEGDLEYDKRMMIALSKFKALGLLAGAPDIGIIHNGILYKLELKLPKRPLKDSQKRLHPIWNRDCPQIPIVICYTIYDIHITCTKIIKANLKIDFTPLFVHDINFNL